MTKRSDSIPVSEPPAPSESANRKAERLWNELVELGAQIEHYEEAAPNARSSTEEFIRHDGETRRLRAVFEELAGEVKRIDDDVIREDAEQYREKQRTHNAMVSKDAAELRDLTSRVRALEAKIAAGQFRFTHMPDFIVQEQELNSGRTLDPNGPLSLRRDDLARRIDAMRRRRTAA